MNAAGFLDQSMSDQGHVCSRSVFWAALRSFHQEASIEKQVLGFANRWECFTMGVVKLVILISLKIPVGIQHVWSYFTSQNCQGFPEMCQFVGPLGTGNILGPPA